VVCERYSAIEKLKDSTIFTDTISYEKELNNMEGFKNTFGGHTGETLKSSGKDKKKRYDVIADSFPSNNSDRGKSKKIMKDTDIDLQKPKKLVEKFYGSTSRRIEPCRGMTRIRAKIYQSVQMS